MGIGTHTIRLELVSSTGKVLSKAERKFQINRRVFKGNVLIDSSVQGLADIETNKTKIEITGWAVGDPKGSIEIYKDGKKVAGTNNITRYERNDIKTDKAAGTESGLVKSVGKIGYKYTINENKILSGNSEIKVVIKDRWGNKIKEATKVINYKEYSSSGVIEITSPKEMKVSTIPSYENNVDCNLIVEGWALSSDPNAKVRLYMDGALWISDVTRTNKKAEVDGYEDLKSKTAKQGTISLLNIESLGIGTHTIRLELVSSEGKVLSKAEKRFQVNKRVFEGETILNNPVEGLLVLTKETQKLEIIGGAEVTDPKGKIELYIDNKLLANKDTLKKYNIEDVDIDGFKYTLDLNNVSRGKHVIKLIVKDRWKRTIKEELRNIRVEEDIKYGVDLSYANENVDWDKLSNTGTSFAIIRVGYYIDSKGTFKLDDQFERNYAEAKKRNIKLGAYVYSYAFNGEEGRKEAEAALKHLKGKSFELPIFIDVEDKLISNNWNGKVTRDSLTDAAVEFCSLMNENGFEAGIYANKTWLELYLDTARLQDYNIWLANYTWDSTSGITYNFHQFGELPAYPNYSSRIDIWQYTSSGYILGNDRRFDLNVSFKDYLK